MEVMLCVDCDDGLMFYHGISFFATLIATIACGVSFSPTDTNKMWLTYENTAFFFSPIKSGT